MFSLPLSWCLFITWLLLWHHVQLFIIVRLHTEVILCQLEKNGCQLKHCPDDGGSMYLWNVGRHLLKNTAVYPRRFWASYSPPWELEISQGPPYIKSNIYRYQIHITLINYLMWNATYTDSSARCNGIQKLEVSFLELMSQHIFGRNYIHTYIHTYLPTQLPTYLPTTPSYKSYIQVQLKVL
jgi:hypothetical protein